MGVSTVCVKRTRQKKKQQTKKIENSNMFVVVDNRKRLTKINDFITLKSQSIYELSITTLKIRKEKIHPTTTNNLIAAAAVS